jgi:multidrug efflux pump subunit AcrB
MKLTEFSVRHPQFTVLVFLALASVGGLAFLEIPRAEDPDPKFPGATVIVQFPGANQRDLEEQVARPIEDAIAELERVEKIITQVQDGVAVINVDFTYGSDADDKYDEVLRQVTAVRGELPAELQSIEVRRFRTTDVALVQAALVSDTADYGRLGDLAEALRKRLERVPGVRRAEETAFPARQVRVELDLERMAALALPLGRVLDALGGDNLNLPGGAVELGDRRFNLKTSGYYTSLDQIRATPLTGDGAAVVRVGDVANVRWDYEDLEYFARLDGRRAVWVTATMKDGQKVVRVRDRVAAALAEFRALVPAEVELAEPFDQSRNIARRLGTLQRDFLIALGLVLLTVLPLGLRASMLVMFSIPLSLAMGVALLHFTGQTLNQLSIVGLIVALGLLVDDSIVVVENIARFRRQGVAPIEAAVQGTQQIAVAVVGTTATLLFAFLPLLALPGGPGMFIRSLPLAVVYTVAASLLVALTIVPFLASRALTGRENPEGNALLRLTNRIINATYRPALHWSMRHRGATLVGAGALFLGSLALVPVIGFSLFPVAGIPQFRIAVSAPEGTSVAATDALAREIETRLGRFDFIASVMTNVGRGNPQVYYNVPRESQRANVAELIVTLRRYDPKTAPAQFEAVRAALEDLPGATIVVKEYTNGPPIAAPIEVRIFGEDLDALARLAAQVEGLLAAVPGATGIDNPLRLPRTDLRLAIDRPQAAMLGVPLAEIDRAARFGVAGLIATRYRDEEGDAHAVRVLPARGDRADLAALPRIHVATTEGRAVPLAQLAALEFEPAPNQISRFDRERYVGLTAEVVTGFNTGRVTAEIARRLEELPLPPGYRIAFGGEVESSAESFGGIGTAIVVALFGVLAVLVLEFRSFRGTLVVASVLPLGAIGGIVALALAGYTLSFTAAIGFIALVGIEIKNSILLVDFTNQLRQQGVALREAIERAGEVRFLPVVLTTLTALGALAPVAIEGSGLYSPLAVVIMGGLVSSLLLSRLVTPVVYSLLPPPAPEPGEGRA